MDIRLDKRLFDWYSLVNINLEWNHLVYIKQCQAKWIADFYIVKLGNSFCLLLYFKTKIVFPFRRFLKAKLSGAIATLFDF